MDHGRVGPPGILGGAAGAPNVIRVGQGGREIVPEHLSKGEDFRLEAGDWIEVHTPGGGGYGDPGEREAGMIDRDKRNRYYG